MYCCNSLECVTHTETPRKVCGIWSLSSLLTTDPVPLPAFSSLVRDSVGRRSVNIWATYRRDSTWTFLGKLLTYFGIGLETYHCNFGHQLIGVNLMLFSVNHKLLECLNPPVIICLVATAWILAQLSWPYWQWPWTMFVWKWSLFSLKHCRWLLQWVLMLISRSCLLNCCMGSWLWSAQIILTFCCIYLGFLL